MLNPVTLHRHYYSGGVWGRGPRDRHPNSLNRMAWLRGVVPTAVPVRIRAFGGTGICTRKG